MLRVQALDRWLAESLTSPDVGELTQRLNSMARELDLQDVRRLVNDDRWLKARRAVGDSLVADLVMPGPDDDATGLVRLLLVMGLVESAAEADPPTPGAVLNLLRNRTVVVPSPPFPLDRHLPLRSKLARRSGFTDLWVVRDEWSCYVPGEIAHIETVHKGEVKERVHKRIDERETTDTTETDSLTRNERETQTTDRFQLKDEANKDAELAIRLEGQVDASGQYGVTKIDTHVGGSLDYSVNDSVRHATEQAKETIDRALTVEEERVRRERVVRSLTRVEETNTHTIDN